MPPAGMNGEQDSVLLVACLYAAIVFYIHLENAAVRITRVPPTVTNYTHPATPTTFIPEIM